MVNDKTSTLPVAVIGAGPVGLAAAAHLTLRGIPVKVYEAGFKVGAHIRKWGHVRLFTPWRYCVDGAAIDLLEKQGWEAPEKEAIPTGHELVSRYLEPLAATPALSANIAFETRIVTIARLGLDKITNSGRENRPFILTLKTPGGTHQDLARAVIDASGVWSTPNPLGANGTPAIGEAEYSDRITYGIPDVLGSDRSRYAGKTTLVIGAGHSAANVLLDLNRLSDTAPGTTSLWVTRGKNLSRVYGGGAADDLASRADLGNRLRLLVETGKTRLFAGFSLVRIQEESGRLTAEGNTIDGEQKIGPADQIIVCTGQRPDLSLTRELRLDLDPALECVRLLGPHIDPNLHSCGSVPPHGHRELAHPEKDFYTIGIKSYGRAPTFLLLTGYEQARSVAAALAGDLEAADNVQLTLPETGVCSTQVFDDESETTCCGSGEQERSPKEEGNTDASNDCSKCECSA